MIELRRGDITAAAQHIASRLVMNPQFADMYARPETTAAEAQITEARHGSAAALDPLRQLCAGLEARPGLLLGDPALAAWLARTALAAGDTGLAARAARGAQALADAHPEYAALAAAAAHSRGLAIRDPGLLAEAATRHPDPWARASAAEDLGVLHGRHGERDQAIRYLKEALAGYRQVGADRDQARIRRRLRQLGIRRRHWATPPARPVTGWDSLTDTEQAVAALVAEGLNNKQVAARMYISTHTVATTSARPSASSASPPASNSPASSSSRRRTAHEFSSPPATAPPGTSRARSWRIADLTMCGRARSGQALPWASRRLGPCPPRTRGPQCPSDRSSFSMSTRPCSTWM